jgi:hypothetical protein
MDQAVLLQALGLLPAAQALVVEPARIQVLLFGLQRLLAALSWLMHLPAALNGMIRYDFVSPYAHQLLY